MFRYQTAVLLFVSILSASSCTALLTERRSDTLETETGEIAEFAQQESEGSPSLSPFHPVSAWKRLQNSWRGETPQIAAQLSLPRYLHLRRTKRAHIEGCRSKAAVSRTQQGGGGLPRHVSHSAYASLFVHRRYSEFKVCNGNPQTN